MSATNRGRAREQDDFYPTPVFLTEAMIPYLGQPSRILEPANGDGAIVTVLRKAFPDAQIDGGDIESGEDFLSFRWEPNYYDLIMTNPPYSLAEAFARRALELVAPGGKVVLLGRVSFVESRKRAKWLRQVHPSLYITPRRPCFVRGKSDNCAYAWFVFDGQPSRNVWLDTE